MKIFLIFIFLGFVYADFLPKPIDFNVYKLDSPDLNIKDSKALLIIAGIQGDEPGAFNAASIIITHYKIKSGSVWIIPNLNQHSILRNNRGIYGDMNRKFADLKPNDKEAQIIAKIKSVILDERVGAIFHLHDGSGFYRHTYIDNLHNQNRWGNSSIIDQNTLFQYNDLSQNAEKIIDFINSKLLKPNHKFHIRNTNTASGDLEQLKSLTYFATQNKKMAYANEASKSLSLRERVYYHLLAIEGMFKNLNIEFERDFELDIGTINELINDKNAEISINNIIKIPLFNIKPKLQFFPLEREESKNIFSSNIPIMWFFKDENIYRIKNGNRQIVRLEPFYIEFDFSLDSLNMLIDDEEKEIKIGSIIEVKNHFKIAELPYRVNVIGYQSNKSEVNIDIFKKDLANRFSIDKNNSIFRIEFYKQELGKKDKFSGMILVRFEN